MSQTLHSVPSEGEADPSEEFVALLTQHQQVLFGFILGLVPKRANAEDILQRANVVLWRKREDFALGTSFRSWAFSVARWEARAFLQEQGRRSWLVYDDEVASLLADRLASVPAPAISARAEALRKCLAELGDEHGAFIMDRYQKGLSFSECASRSGRSEAGLRVTMHRLKVALRRCVIKKLGPTR